MLATVQASEYRHYESEGVSLPHRLAISMPPANLNFEITVGEYVINRLLEDPRVLWSPPAVQGQIVDLTAQAPTPAPPAPLRPDAYYSAPRAGFRPRYRGYR